MVSPCELNMTILIFINNLMLKKRNLNPKLLKSNGPNSISKDEIRIAHGLLIAQPKNTWSMWD